MRTLVVLSGITLAFALHVTSAEAAEWCAWYDPYTYNCGFYTLEQCRATVSGDTSAYCARNVRWGSENAQPRRNRDP
jgi:hypothetical protein